MHRNGDGGKFPPSKRIVLMSLARLSLGRLLASRAGLCFTRQNQVITQQVNDVLALISMNDVLALENYSLFTIDY